MGDIRDGGIFRGKITRVLNFSYYYHYHPINRWNGTEWEPLNEDDLKDLFSEADENVEIRGDREDKFFIWFVKDDRISEKEPGKESKEAYKRDVNTWSADDRFVYLKIGRWNVSLDIIPKTGQKCYRLNVKKGAELRDNGDLKPYDPSIDEALRAEAQNALLAEEAQAEAEEAPVEEVPVEEAPEPEDAGSQASSEAPDEAIQGLQQELSDLEAQRVNLLDEVHELEAHRDELARETERLVEERTAALKEAFLNALDHQWTKMAEVSLDGAIASRMLRAASDWEALHPEAAPAKASDRKAPAIQTEFTGEKLVSYICGQVQKFRPHYKGEQIVNIAVCLTEGFLTVFYGPPGCGKTSICDLFARVLGLGPEQSQRYVPVSVERGWMSKRDFIGYFNPLTRTFDSSNRQVYDALMTLSGESGDFDQPWLILLDEANLSAMEYYWADFMNLCDMDGGGDRGPLDLGEKTLTIPDKLRFAATINVDHTTETLSPRVISRAWVVCLPKNEDQDFSFDLEQKNLDSPENLDSFKIVSWQAMEKTFQSQKAKLTIPANIQEHFKAVKKAVENCGGTVSHRVTQAVGRYWAGARQAYEWLPDQPEDPDRTALDYAVAQRVLPQLQGSGEGFKANLETLKETCKTHGLTRSEAIVENILDKGKDSEYFQFFC